MFKAPMLQLHRTSALEGLDVAVGGQAQGIPTAHLGRCEAWLQLSEMAFYGPEKGHLKTGMREDEQTWEVFKVANALSSTVMIDPEQ